MPRYDYKCTACGEIEEKVFPLNAEQIEVTHGMHCDFAPMKRVYTTPIRFNLGWKRRPGVNPR